MEAPVNRITTTTPAASAHDVQLVDMPRRQTLRAYHVTVRHPDGTVDHHELGGYSSAGVIQDVLDILPSGADPRIRVEAQCTGPAPLDPPALYAPLRWGAIPQPTPAPAAEPAPAMAKTQATPYREPLTPEQIHTEREGFRLHHEAWLRSRHLAPADLTADTQPPAGPELQHLDDTPQPLRARDLVLAVLTVALITGTVWMLSTTELPYAPSVASTAAKVLP